MRTFKISANHQHAYSFIGEDTDNYGAWTVAIDRLLVPVQDRTPWHRIGFNPFAAINCFREHNL